MSPAEFPEAGRNHGFDLTLPTIKSGRQPSAPTRSTSPPANDRMLGCKSATIPVALRLSALKASRKKVRVRVTCLWPAGDECPLQLLLRSRFKRRLSPTTAAAVPAPARSAGWSAAAPSGSPAVRPRLPRPPHRRRTGAAADPRGAEDPVIAAIPGGRRTAVVNLRR